ncbi:Protein Dok-7 [Dermatophagoides farinae]|uniref:Protein Dok-7 n=1 Tax=Dermatophagoides farinae TaxID=6954 RepID=A0A922HRS2_DERFA|nr:Protein Dok-7 [Dermatophagoides farinae]
MTITTASTTTTTTTTTMMESSQIILLEGPIKYRDQKKWKSRWAIITKLSPIAENFIINVKWFL